ncbi:hypothetical protein CBM2592_A120036 [Cupriavidus taiwanensis]|nr:hypothetical protein CBM2592_A120036 [Cupriavidus taiwanensis]SOY59244.1 hypothetical protein CBM2588_A90036 [Cupriavidus taiwanensis]SOY80205.1 hypothetical protein CBM2591_A140036 [Cupriavidus taiwanensis]SOZ51369.1 hypothetical protein CBM2617_A120035 [Cupriavidus taiwanensis]SOZ76259.1 hypothetical protein CBM2622_A120036 [Cupriavidus taiwanensis]
MPALAYGEGSPHPNRLPQAGEPVHKRELQGIEAMMPLRVCFPLPACGRGAGVRAGASTKSGAQSGTHQPDIHIP